MMPLIDLNSSYMDEAYRILNSPMGTGTDVTVGMFIIFILIFAGIVWYFNE